VAAREEEEEDRQLPQKKPSGTAAAPVAQHAQAGKEQHESLRPSELADAVFFVTGVLKVIKIGALSRFPVAKLAQFFAGSGRNVPALFGAAFAALELPFADLTGGPADPELFNLLRGEPTQRVERHVPGNPNAVVTLALRAVVGQKAGGAMTAFACLEDGALDTTLTLNHLWKQVVKVENEDEDEIVRAPETWRNEITQGWLIYERMPGHKVAGS
jgi:hypothetical protein